MIPSNARLERALHRINLCAWQRCSPYLKVPLTDNKSVGTSPHKLRGKGVSDPDCLHPALMQQEPDLLRSIVACHGCFQGTDRGIGSLLPYSDSSPAVTRAKDEHNHCGNAYNREQVQPHTGIICLTSPFSP